MKKITASWSNCTTALIKEAAQCENYASDLLYDIHDVMKCVDLEQKEPFDTWFGFRDLGVDHKAFITEHVRRGDLQEYRKVYVLRVEYEEGQYYFTLYEPDYEDLCALKEEEEKNQ